LASQEGAKEGKTGSPNSPAPDSSTTVVAPIAEPVVSTPVVKSNDENEPNEDQENDAEKDETQAKDAELISVLSDNEGSRGGRGGEHDGNLSSTWHLTNRLHLR
jgi:hypothetical protein